MEFIKAVSLSIQSSQPLIWVRTHEATEVRRELMNELKNTKVYRWNILHGLIDPDGRQIAIKDPGGVGDLKGPAIGIVMAVELFGQEADKYVKKTEEGIEDLPVEVVLVVDNFHHHVKDPAILQVLQDFTDCDRKRRSSIILISHYDEHVPKDLVSYDSIIDHDLPGEKELMMITEEVLAGLGGPATVVMDKLDNTHLAKLSQAGKGLSRLQYTAEFSFSLALIKETLVKPDGTLQDDITTDNLTAQLVECIQDRKAILFNAEGLIKLVRATDKMDDIGGMEGLKAHVRRRFDRQSQRFRQDRRPKGIILLGPGGTGKSTTARAIANMLGWMLAVIDLGGLKDKHVGASEGRVRRMFQILKAMGKVVAFIDEIEKVFPTGGELDSGVSSDQLATFLKEIEDHNRQYYLVASANQSHKLPGPLTRAGRFDAIVMVDIPKPEQQAKIWAICRRKFGIPEDYELPVHNDWTGAEIEDCCNKADADGITLKEAARQIVPIIRKKPEEVQAVRDSAHETAMDAETWRIYYKPGTTPPSDEPAEILLPSPGRRRGRTIKTNPEAN